MPSVTLTTDNELLGAEARAVALMALLDQGCEDAWLVRELDELEEQIALAPPVGSTSIAVKLRQILRHLVAGFEDESDAPCLQQVVEFLSGTPAPQPAR